MSRFGTPWLTTWLRSSTTLAVLLVAALVISACGDLTPDSLAYTTDEAEPTQIRIATPRIAGFQDAIAAWEREHPTAEVEIVLRANDDHHRSVLNNTGAGGQFDIIAFDSRYGADLRERPEIFLDLAMLGDDLVPQKFLESRWLEGVSTTGSIIGVPIDTETTALIVRTDLINESILDELEQATSWCDILIAGDRFSDETDIAFFADADDLLRAILGQSRSSYVGGQGEIVEADRDELERAWDLAIISLGERPQHGDPCPEAESVQRIARNLAFNDEAWRNALGSDDFAGVLAPWSMRRRISNAAPETSGNWTAIALPTAAAVGGKTMSASSEGGLHLGIPSGSEHASLAYDLISTLADPIIQDLTFAIGQGPLPAAAGSYTNRSVLAATDDFFGDAPIGAIYGDAATSRSKTLAMPQRRIVVDELLAALNRVESGGQTPEEAWADALDNIADAFE